MKELTSIASGPGNTPPLIHLGRRRPVELFEYTLEMFLQEEQASLLETDSVQTVDTSSFEVIGYEKEDLSNSLCAGEHLLHEDADLLVVCQVIELTMEDVGAMLAGIIRER